MNDNNKKITNLKIAKRALTALSKTCALIHTPITAGIAIATGLGAAITEILLDNKNNQLAPIK